MALATRCPNCHALFRVVADQLKLRGGLVRCGACDHVFDAIGTLSYFEDATPAAAARRSTDPTAAGEPTAAAESIVAASAPAPVAVAIDDSPAETPIEPTGQAARETAAPIDAAARPTEAPPDTNIGEPGEAQPAFLRPLGGRQERGRRILIGAAATVLLVLLLAQLAAIFRAEILVRAPGARPALNQLCRVFGCTVNWPARGDLLAVVGSELQALPGSDALELTAVVRSRAAFTLALPAIELTLTDAQNRTLARKVFAPVDYLGAEAPARQLAGLEAGGDLTIRIAFEARGINAAGFVVYPFYL